VRRSIETPSCAEMTPRYFVFGSRTPGMFNLGGDLAFFAQAIRAGNRERLRSYAYDCVEAIHLNLGVGLPLTSIALVEGDALGGGFEAALSFDVVIAERSAKLGLPEILFNLFPGMGAYSLLSRRMDSVRAERMILSGRLYGAEELHAMGLVDIVAEDGCGAMAAQDYIAANRRSYVTRQTLFGIRKMLNPISREELREVTDRWVEAAFSLGDQDLRRMEQLTAAQRRRRRSAMQAATAL
jgi:DSF synthase